MSSSLVKQAKVGLLFGLIVGFTTVSVFLFGMSFILGFNQNSRSVNSQEKLEEFSIIDQTQNRQVIDNFEPLQDDEAQQCTSEESYSIDLQQCIPNTQAFDDSTFPDLDLNFDNTWQEESTNIPWSKNADSPLQERIINLTKGGTTLTFKLFPSFSEECTTSTRGRELSLLQPNLNTSSVSRFDTASGAGDIYSYASATPSAGCISERVFIHQTTLQTSESEVIKQNGKAIYWMTVEVKGAEFLTEADRIISSSTLYSNEPTGIF